MQSRQEINKETLQETQSQLTCSKYNWHEHHHVCAIYQEDKDQITMVADFITNGISNNYKVLFMDDIEPRRQEILDLVEGSSECIQRGSIHISNSASSYLTDGYFTPDKLFALMRALSDIAISEGYKGVYITAEPLWIHEADPETYKAFLEYESRLTNVAIENNFIMLCQYSTFRWKADTLRDVLFTHPTTLVEEKLFENYYYVPADELLSAERDRHMVGRWLDTLKQRKHEKEALVAARESAEKANLTKTNFINMLSHEMRTPMNGILGMIDVLKGETLSQDQQEQVGIIGTSADHLLDMINNILDAAKLEAGKITLDPKPTSVRKVVSDAINVMRTTANKKGVALVQDIDESVPKWIQGDELRLRQVLLNLLSNAVKFSKDTPVEVLVATGEDRKSGVHLQFTVRDHGVGIDPQRISSLFQPFTQLNRNMGGTGLGLYISRQLVEMMNGKIWCESQVGEGSSFHFTINTTEAEYVPEVPQEINLLKYSNLRILFADDNELNQLVFKKMVARYGCNVTLANNGKEVTDSVNIDNYDIIFIDLFMPIQDGWTTARILKNRFANLPPNQRPWIVFSTGHVFLSEEEQSMVKELQVDIIYKPFTLTALQTVFDRYLNQQ